MGQFTVTIKMNDMVLVSRSATRISGGPGELSLYVTDDGRTIEHHYDHGAATLAIRMLSSVHNILPTENRQRAMKWERAQRKLVDGRPQFPRVSGTAVRKSQKRR